MHYQKIASLKILHFIMKLAPQNSVHSGSWCFIKWEFGKFPLWKLEDRKIVTFAGWWQFEKLAGKHLSTYVLIYSFTFTYSF